MSSISLHSEQAGLKTPSVVSSEEYRKEHGGTPSATSAMGTREGSPVADFINHFSPLPPCSSSPLGPVLEVGSFSPWATSPNRKGSEEELALFLEGDAARPSTPYPFGPAQIHLSKSAQEINALFFLGLNPERLDISFGSELKTSPLAPKKGVTDPRVPSLAMAGTLVSTSFHVERETPPIPGEKDLPHAVSLSGSLIKESLELNSDDTILYNLGCALKEKSNLFDDFDLDSLKKFWSTGSLDAFIDRPLSLGDKSMSLTEISKLIEELDEEQKIILGHVFHLKLSKKDLSLGQTLRQLNTLLIMALSSVYKIPDVLLNPIQIFEKTLSESEHVQTISFDDHENARLECLSHCGNAGAQWIKKIQSDPSYELKNIILDLLELLEALKKHDKSRFIFDSSMYELLDKFHLTWIGP
jgi:hypothetical protein